MPERQQQEYEAFIVLEHSKYKDGHVTPEERESFAGDLRLIRSFPLPEHIAPNAAYRGEMKP